MALDCLVTLDAGTGSGRCVVFDVHGRPLAKAQEPFTYRVVPNPDVPYVRGFDLVPDAFWGALARCVRNALAALPSDVVVRGVAATSQREGCVFLDADGVVLYGGPNLDSRAVLEGLELQERIPPARLHAITGHAPPYIFPAARWLWFRKHHDAGRVATLLMLNDWITFQLTGVAGAEPSNASESLLYDVSRRVWSEEIRAALDVPARILPPVRETGAFVGGVTPAAAVATGLPEGIPVFAGGADTESALLGSGVVTPGETGVVLGTTTPVQMVADRPLLDPAGNLWTSCHVVPDRWVLESNAGDTGGAYRWLLELVFGASDAAAHAAAEDLVGACPPDGRGVLAYLGPVVFDLAGTSPFHPAGLLFRFPLLHVDRPSRGDIFRAFFDNVAFAVRGNCEQITAVAGVPVTRLRASGGLTQSRRLTQELADVLRVPVDVAVVPESASLGSAILAAVGAGLYRSLDEAVAAMVRTTRVEPAAGADHDARYAKWREVQALLRTWTL